ncbi:MAG: outer membrane beta-barrel protein [Pseudomonadota bacterium]
MKSFAFSRKLAVFTSCSTLALLALAPAASAADLDVAVKADSWSGAYVGVAIGAGGAVNELEAPFGPGITASLDGIGAEGYQFSGGIGYDYQFNSRVVFGLMADYTWSNIETDLGVTIDGLGSGGYDLEADNAFSILGRVGALSGPDTLIYGLAGYSYQSFDGSLGIFDDVGDPVFGTSYDFDLNGLTIGAGIENRIGNGLALKLEYRYTSFENVDIIPGFLSANPTFHTVRLGLNYRFGADGNQPDVAAIPYDWTGFLFGIEGGAGTNVTELYGGIPGAGSGSFDGLGASGGTVGLRIGYDYQFANNFVAGVQVAGRLSRQDFEINVNTPGGDVGLAELSESYQFSVTGRLGYTATPDTLWYVLGGYTWGETDLGIFSTDITSFDREGYTVGVGVETALSQNITAGLEYRFTQYDDNGILPPIVNAENSSHAAMFSLNYKFRP